jgi:hypothetical protein
MAPKRDRFAAFLDTSQFERTIKKHRTVVPALPDNPIGPLSSSSQTGTSSSDPISPATSEDPLAAADVDIYGLTVLATAVLNTENDIAIQPEAIGDELLETVLQDIQRQAVSS